MAVNVGTVLTYQTGTPFQLSGTGSGGFRTYNNVADSGVNLNGISVQQLQAAVGVYRVTAAQNGGNAVNFVDLINPQFWLRRREEAPTRPISPLTPLRESLVQRPFCTARTSSRITSRLLRACRLPSGFTLHSRVNSSTPSTTQRSDFRQLRSAAPASVSAASVVSQHQRVIEFRANLTF